MVRLLSASVLISVSFLAQSIELDGELTQGSLVRGEVEAGSTVRLNGDDVNVTETGHFVIGFGRDTPLGHTLEVVSPAGEVQSQAITLTKRDYRIQRIEGIAKKIMKPNPANVDRAQQDAKQARQARSRFEQRQSWQQQFIWPVTGPITGVYGSQRFYNGEPKSPHYGVDVAAPTGTTVVAPADGIITLAVPDMFYSGGTVIIDHGYGVSSTFLHLSKLSVEVEQEVKQGELVGQVGATGRVTGPHLDWRMNWFGERVDPQLLVPAMTK
ncbi:M23 family metallopeptidase [Ferrimonas lipolytica]|uniref:M23 family metallopeptidase n=1 Tax=Ferrimonas lipolytica TaxID=2724191 RepID=A0A6H1UDF0_9GAMM|nr:M23 family metallopeptidase [Ferrimonas lipolytica]QIZ76373.1 M23 family metallopeptidase [Ferrimonas lipolytica]